MAKSFILKVVDAHHQGAWLFKIFSIFSVAMAFAAWFIAINNVALAVSSAMFNILAAYLNWWPRYRRLPGSIIISFQMAIFFSLPVVWIGLTLSSYDFTAYFVTPGSNDLYSQSLPLAIGYLAIAMFSLIAGMLLGTRSRKIAPVISDASSLKYTFERAPLILLVVMVAWIGLLDTLEVIASIGQRFEADRVGKGESLIALLLNDAAFLLLFPSLFYSTFLGAKRLNTHFAKRFYLCVSIIFILIYTAGSSKAGILLVFLPMYLYPIALNYSSTRFVYWPTWLTFVILAIAAAALFSYSMISRQLLSTGGALSALSFGLVLNVITESNNYSGDLFLAMFSPILDRLSSSLNNYVVIFTHYYSGYDLAFAADFAEYLLKSFANLMLPGTPFLDAYLPSSSMLPKVLEKSELIGLGDSSTFWVSANTQSYTIFGVLLILVGPVMALPILMTGGFLYAHICARLTSPIYRNLLIFGFSLILSSYGVEVAMQTIAHFFVTTSFMVLLVYSSHRIIRIFHSSHRVNREGVGNKSAL